MPLPDKLHSESAVTGEVVSSVPGFVLVKKPGTKRRTQVAASESAATLLPKLAQALGHPGISKEAVFKGRKHNVYSYSVDTTDTTRIVRVSADGRRTIGRLVGDKFVALKVT
jgi:hypothetical protein